MNENYVYKATIVIDNIPKEDPKEYVLEQLNDWLDGALAWGTEEHDIEHLLFDKKYDCLRYIQFKYGIISSEVTEKTPS